MRRLLPVLFAAGLTLAACGSSDGGGGDQADDTDRSCEASAGGELGIQPVILIPADCDPPTELLIEDLAEGEGDPVEVGDDVVVDYELYLWRTRTEADSSWDAGQPLPVHDVGGPESTVIDGWNEGLIGMKEHGRRLLVIPPDKAYGGDSTNPLSADTLVFVVDLNEITTTTDATDSTATDSTGTG